MRMKYLKVQQKLFPQNEIPLECIIRIAKTQQSGHAATIVGPAEKWLQKRI